MRTMIDLDDELLTSAQRELGTTTKKDTVNEALRFVVERQKRVQARLHADLSDRVPGWGDDIGDSVVMKDARR